MTFFFKFPYNFCGDFRIPAIPVKFICILQGTPCDTGIHRTFYGGKICSGVIMAQVWYVDLPCLLHWLHICRLNPFPVFNCCRPKALQKLLSPVFWHFWSQDVDFVCMSSPCAGIKQVKIEFESFLIKKNKNIWGYGKKMHTNTNNKI